MDFFVEFLGLLGEFLGFLGEFTDLFGDLVCLSSVVFSRLGRQLPLWWMVGS